MDAKEIIAQAIETAYGPTLGRTIPLCVLEALRAAGYRIIHDSENHEPTLERTIGVLLPRLPRANTRPPTDAVRPTPPPPSAPRR